MEGTMPNDIYRSSLIAVLLTTGSVLVGSTLGFFVGWGGLLVPLVATALFCLFAHEHDRRGRACSVCALSLSLVLTAGAALSLWVSAYDLHLFGWVSAAFASVIFLGIGLILDELLREAVPELFASMMWPDPPLSCRS
jgi:hypothetical protein